MKKIKENVQFDKGRPNYYIGRAPNYVPGDREPEFNLKYLIQRSQESQLDMQKQQMVAQLDNLEPLFLSLFRNMTDIRNFIKSKYDDPIIGEDKRKIMVELVRQIDRLNKDLSLKILPKLDELGND